MFHASTRRIRNFDYHTTPPRPAQPGRSVAISRAITWCIRTKRMRPAFLSNHSADRHRPLPCSASRGGRDLTAGRGVPGVGCRVRDAGCGVQGAGCAWSCHPVMPIGGVRHVTRLGPAGDTAMDGMGVRQPMEPRLTIVRPARHVTNGATPAGGRTVGGRCESYASHARWTACATSPRDRTVRCSRSTRSSWRCART